MDYINIAMPKGKMFESSFKLFKSIGFDFKDLECDTRQLTFADQFNKMKYCLAKPSDVPTFVEFGCCDIGIVGLDTILEEERNISEIIDLGFSKCKMVVAGRDKNIDYSKIKIVATKYPKIATQYFESKGIFDLQIIKLNGSVELAAVCNLSDVIVDIVDTGNTLKENGLKVIEEICDLSARLIINSNISKSKEAVLNKIINLIQNEINQINKKIII